MTSEQNIIPDQGRIWKLLTSDFTKADWKRLKTTEPMDNVKSHSINDGKFAALGNKLEILIIS